MTPAQMALLRELARGPVYRQALPGWGFCGKHKPATLVSLDRRGYVALTGGGAQITMRAGIPCHSFRQHDKATITDAGRAALRETGLRETSEAL